MPEIKYIVLTDLHLGAENSLMTNLVKGGYQTDTSQPSPVMKCLVDCLRQLLTINESGSKPKLILNGDLMELALTTMNDASMAFQRFIELVLPEDDAQRMFDPEILFIPGNHDHNLWETSRYNHYIDNIKKMVPGEKIVHLAHATRMFEAPVMVNYLLTCLVQMYPHLKQLNADIKVAYPAFAELHPKKDKCVIFSHGHFIESLYTLMTTVDEMFFPERPKPSSLNEIEMQNFAWIDFFWSTMGRSGIVGKDIQLLYDKIQDEMEVKKLIDRFAKNISLKRKNWFMRWVEYKVLKEVLMLTIARQASNERNQEGILSGDCNEGLRKYMEIFIRNEIEFELQNKAPNDITFLFGHTHKPFQQSMTFAGYPAPVKVYNSGGWVVDTVDTMSYHGGSIILVDTDLNVVALNMYKEGRYSPVLERIGNEENELYNQLSRQFDFKEEPWLSFEHQVDVEVNLRHEYLKQMIKAETL